MKCNQGIQSVWLLDVFELESVAGGRASTTTIGETFSGNGGASHANVNDPGQTRFGEATGGSMSATEGCLQ
jgi:hypothetical protein